MVAVVEASFLVVEDEGLVALAYRQALRGHGSVTVAPTVAEAREVFARCRPTGLVTDISLPDGSGLDVAREARARSRDLPILIVSGDVTPERMAVAVELEAGFLWKPIDPKQLALFAERAVARGFRLDTLLKDWIDRYALSAAEAVTFRCAVDGLRRAEIAETRGVSQSTVKNQIAGMLPKVGAADLSDAVLRFYREMGGAT